jgi:hypothetical protein
VAENNENNNGVMAKAAYQLIANISEITAKMIWRK